MNIKCNVIVDACLGQILIHSNNASHQVVSCPSDCVKYNQHTEEMRVV